MENTAITVAFMVLVYALGFGLITLAVLGNYLDWWKHE